VPGELAWPLESGTDLVLKTHLVSSSLPTDIQVSIGFFFTETPPIVTPVVVQLGSQTIDLPAGDPAHVVEDTYELPVDVDLLAIYPPAHFLLGNVEASAELPDGTTRPLLRIDDWDFNWQDEYRYAEQVRLPARTTIRMRYVYDNSEDNSNNPSRPPRRVRFGPRSTDEMAELTLQVLPVDPSDRLTLAQDVGRKVARIILAGSKKKVTDDPTSANHENYAVSLVAVGRVDEAVEQLEEAIRLDPESATAHYRLGTALTIQGKRDDAIDCFRQAVDLDPDFAEAHNSLGGLLQLAGNVVEAERHYRRALQLDPSHGGAHLNLGNILLGAERFAESEAQFRATLALRPESADGYTGLGQALAGQGKRAEAQAAADRARELESTRP
jgi:tetratricopeptide (TPR) repeat protein